MHDGITRCRKSFSNVSVHETIKIIKENVYNHPSIPPPAIQPKILEKFLLSCTKKFPFYDPSDNIYVQIDRFSMVSQLGPTIFEFYMSYIENKIVKTTISKPKIYIRYVDDIFIAAHSYKEINKFKPNSRKNLALNFISELNINKKNAFLEFLTDSINNNNVSMFVRLRIYWRVS